MKQVVMVMSELKIRDAKAEIINLMKTYVSSKNDEDRKKLIDYLQKCSIDDSLKKEFNDDNTEYLYCGLTRSCYYAYYINCNGNIILVHDEDPIDNKRIKEITNNISSYKIQDLKLKDRYIESRNEKVSLATNYDVYKFMQDAGWLEKDGNQSGKILAENLRDESFSYERLEIHHINNNPNDNRVDNLVYLPHSIHCKAHKYIDDKDYKGVYAFELTSDEYEKVTNYIKDLRK